MGQQRGITLVRMLRYETFESRAFIGPEANHSVTSSVQTDQHGSLSFYFVRTALFERGRLWSKPPKAIFFVRKCPPSHEYRHGKPRPADLTHRSELPQVHDFLV